MWYIYNSENIIIITCSGEPDPDDLATRSEKSFYHPGQLELGWRVIFDDDGNPIGAVPPQED